MEVSEVREVMLVIVGMYVVDEQAGGCDGGGPHQVSRQQATKVRGAVTEAGRGVTAGVVAKPRGEGCNVGGLHHVAHEGDILPSAREGGEIDVCAAHIGEHEHNDARRRRGRRW